jgi:heavy metal translocating P-type ATPase
MFTAMMLLLGAGASLLHSPAWAGHWWATGALVMALVLLVEIFKRLMQGEAGVDVIALLSMTVALILGQSLVAVVIALMLASGRTLEFFTKQRAERELRALIDRAPRTAWLQEENGLRKIPVENIQLGQMLLVRQGEVVPVDGRLRGNAALLDEASLSGEPLPVNRLDGDEVRSGVTNCGAPIRIIALRVASQSTYAAIVRLAEAARRSRAPFVRLADRYALIFIPVTVLMAGVAWLMSGDPSRALAVLVVATPCPLILAVPIAIMSGISRAARRGILIKDGQTLEALEGIKQVFFDKTGTLTSGHARLQSIEVNGTADPEQLLGLAASLAQESTHPISQAIVESAHQRQIVLSVPQEVEEQPGSGLQGVVNGRRLRFGTLAFAHTSSVVSDWADTMLQRLDYLACSGSFLEVDGALVGLLVFSDSVRCETPQTLRRLRARGISRIVMLTGDRLETAEMTALSAGIDELRAGLTPEAKVQAVQEGCRQASTLMVGDGVNDAPALAAATVGVAMGAQGATAAAQAAGVVLLVERLDRLVEALDIARRACSIARQGVVVGMGLSLLAMTAAALGVLPALIGAVVQEGIDVLIIGNALRALWPAGGNEPRKLSPAYIDQLLAEHQQLSSLLEELTQLACCSSLRLPAQLKVDVAALVSKLQSALTAHERKDETSLYPLLSQGIPGDDPLWAMSHVHREIFRGIHLLARLSSDFSASPGNDVPDALRQQLIRLDTLLRLHFDQEDELFRGLDAR